MTANSGRGADEVRDRRRRVAARAALPDALERAARLRRAGVVEAGDVEYVVREMQQTVMDRESVDQEDV